MRLYIILKIKAMSFRHVISVIVMDGAKEDAGGCNRRAWFTDLIQGAET